MALSIHCSEQPVPGGQDPQHVWHDASKLMLQTCIPTGVPQVQFVRMHVVAGVHTFSIRYVMHDVCKPLT